MAERSGKVARKYVVSGRVQGVGFRFFTEKWAVQDGSVEVYAIADAVTLEEFKRQLTEGPRSSRVTGMSESDEPVDKHYGRFVIEDIW